MKEIIWIAALLFVFAFCFYIMKCVDKLLNENDNNAQIDGKAKEPSCVMLTGDLSDDEILREIHYFRNRHKGFGIFLCDDTATGVTPYICAHTNDRQ